MQGCYHAMVNHDLLCTFVLPRVVNHGVVATLHTAHRLVLFVVLISVFFYTPPRKCFGLGTDVE